MTTLNWRSAVAQLLPRWAKGTRQGGNPDPNAGWFGWRVMHVVGLTLDALGDALNEGLWKAFPGATDDETALALQGAERGIMRGPLEASEAYARRLRRWRQARKRQGNPIELAVQIQAYLQPYPMTVQIQYSDGTCYTIDPGAYLVDDYQGADVVHASTRAWDWDGTDEPTRFWVLLGCVDANTPWASDGLWGGGSEPWNELNTDDGTATGTVLDPLAGGDTTPTYGSTASLASVQGLLALVQDMTPPHARCECIVYAFNASEFAVIAPNGTWGDAGSRGQAYVYWEIPQQ
jgi:hypothetical protein